MIHFWALIAFAAMAAAGAVILILSAVLPRRHKRQPTEPEERPRRARHRSATCSATAADPSMHPTVLPNLGARQRATGIAAVQEQTPEVHRGADEEYGRELRRARTAPVAEELMTSLEWQMADHNALDVISTAVDEYDDLFWQRIDRFLMDERASLAVRERADRFRRSIDQTGELSRTALDELLVSAS